jgi:hypothetical protein
MPYKEMSAFGWVPETGKRRERVINLRNIFGVVALSAIPEAANVLFRKHKPVKKISDPAVMAWLRKAELAGLILYCIGPIGANLTWPPGGSCRAQGEDFTDSQRGLQGIVRFAQACPEGEARRNLG